MATCNDLSGFIDALTGLRTDALKLNSFVNGQSNERVSIGGVSSQTLAGFCARLDRYIEQVSEYISLIQNNVQTLNENIGVYSTKLQDDVNEYSDKLNNDINEYSTRVNEELTEYTGKLQAFADSSEASVTIGEYAIPTLHQLVADVQADVESFGSQLSSYVGKVGAFVNGAENATVNLGGVQVPTLRHMANDVANSVSANGAKLDTFVNGTATETVVLGNGAGATAEPTIRNMIAQINSLRQIILDSVLDVEGADLSARNATAEGGTAPRVFADRFGDVLSPKDFGAVGDGVTDDTAAWEAWDAVYGSMKFVPAGRYLVNGKVKSFAYGAYINLRETKEKDRLYVYIPCQNVPAASLDPGTMQFGYARESIILKQGDTVVMVDTAGIEAVTRMRNFLASIGVDHVDYLILTHYHEDHCTGFSGFTGTVNGTSYDCTDTLDGYIDFSHCKVFLPVACHTIDERWDEVARFSASEFDDAVLAKLQSLGITPVYPNELDTLVVSNSLKITFLNAGLDELNEIFDIHAERHGEDERLAINDCSMCCLVEHENATMLLTGDIQDCGEARLAAKYQRLKTASCTPGVVSPVPVEITGMGGTKFSYISDYLDMNGDSIGALYSAASLYRKALSPDVYKINHHGVNTLASYTCPEFYELLTPKMAAVVTTFTRYDRILAATTNANSPSLLRCPIYNAYLDDVKLASDGNEFTCVYGQVDWVDRSKKLIRPGDNIQPYRAVSSAESIGENFYTWLKITFVNPSLMGWGRGVSIIAHISAIADTQKNASGIFEFKISCYSPDASGRENGTYINCIYGNSDYFNANTSLGIIYLGDNTYELVVLQSTQCVYNISILSIVGQESVLSITPVCNRYRTLTELSALVLPQWFYRAEPGFIGGATNSRINGTLRILLNTRGTNDSNGITVSNPLIPMPDVEHDNSIKTRIVFTGEQLARNMGGLSFDVYRNNSTRMGLWTAENKTETTNTELNLYSYIDENHYESKAELIGDRVYFNVISERDTKYAGCNPSFQVGGQNNETTVWNFVYTGKNASNIAGVTATAYVDREETTMTLWATDAFRSDEGLPSTSSQARLTVTKTADGDKKWSTNGMWHDGVFTIKSSLEERLALVDTVAEVGNYASDRINRIAVADKDRNLLSGATTQFSSDFTTLRLYACNGHRTDGVATPDATDNASLEVFRYSDGTKLAKCPTPAASSNTNDIATTAWVRTFISSSSDRRDKTDFAAIGDRLLDAWDGVEFSLFRFASGESSGDTDKLHAGVVAQDLASMLWNRGIDAEDYGFVVHEHFDAHGRDENGPEERYRVRYNEIAVIEAAYVRRRLARIEERLASLEG